MVSASGDGLVRINIRLSDRKTSVSMDAELYEALVERHGSERAAIAWVEAEARALEALEALEGEGARMGLSRLVQRRALRVLLGKDSPERREPPTAEAGVGLSPALSTAAVDNAPRAHGVDPNALRPSLRQRRMLLRAGQRSRGLGRGEP